MYKSPFPTYIEKAFGKLSPNRYRFYRGLEIKKSYNMLSKFHKTYLCWLYSSDKLRNKTIDTRSTYKHEIIELA